MKFKITGRDWMSIKDLKDDIEEELQGHLCKGKCDITECAAYGDDCRPVVIEVIVRRPKTEDETCKLTWPQKRMKKQQ